MKAEGEVARLLAGVGELEHVDPSAALAAALSRAAAAADALSRLVAALDADVDGLVEHPATGLYLAAVDRLAAVASTAMRLGLADREARVEAEMGAVVADIIELLVERFIEQVAAGATADDLTATWRPMARAAVEAVAGNRETP